MVSATCPSPNDPLWNGSVPRYFRGTFHSILFQNFPVQPLPRQTIPTIFPSPRIFLIVQWYTNAKGHWCRPCSHHPRFFYFFNPDYVRQPKGILDSNQGEMYVIISEQLAPAHSWTRSLLELHVHHCLGEPHHLLFPRLRGFLLLIATWRSRMVCLSLSAGIPGLELPEHKGLILSPNIQPLFGLFSSLLESRSMFSSLIF